MACSFYWLQVNVCLMTLIMPSVASVCQSPLGMEDGRIHDSQLSASSSFNILTIAQMGRLNGNEGHGAWCPYQGRNWYSDRRGGPFIDQYFQVQLMEPIRISAIVTQGRAKFGGIELVRYYYVNYTKGKAWIQYRDWTVPSAKKFTGNKGNVNYTKINRLVPPIIADAIRIIPEIFPVNQVCLRLELYGCHLKQDLVSYTMKPGNERGSYKLTDHIFDGAISSTLLTSGLGHLTDGVLASPDFRDNYGRGWIGWHITATPSPFIVFTFLKAQVFRSVMIHCNIRTRSSVELFDAAKVGFSMDGVTYNTSVMHASEDVTSGYKWINYNVTVDLCLNTGKFVHIGFDYRGEWILLSEVTFQNEPVGSKSPEPKCVHVPSSKPTSEKTLPAFTGLENSTRNGTIGGDSVEGGSDELGGGVIAGIVCAVLLLVILLIMFLCWWCYKKHRRHHKKPSFYHFIRWELKPFAGVGYDSAVRVSRILSEKDEEKSYSFKKQASLREPDRVEAAATEGTSDVCPIYASINNLDEAGVAPQSPEKNQNGVKESNTSWSISRGKVGKPKNKPPPLPSDSVDDVLEVYYAQPDSPLLVNQPPVQDMVPDYAEPEASPDNNLLLSPKHKILKSPPRTPLPRSPPASPLPTRPDKEDGYYAEPDDPVVVSPVKSVPIQNNPLGGYSEPIDSLVPNDDVFANPVYEEIYSEPYQGVSGTSLYANPSTEIQSRHDTFKEFARDKLHFKEKIGDGQFGEVHLGEAEGLGEILGEEFKNCKRVLVAIKNLKSDVDKNIKHDFFKEVKIMAGVRHENVVRLLGVCRDDPMCMIVEYMVNGDLNQFLKEREMAPGKKRDREKVITYQALLYMTLQLAAGMKYIASLNFVHRDLATRNCLVGHSYTVKIADFGMSRHLYEKHYYRIQGRVILPIRWMAPECILQGKFTTASDVWAFAVTLWEILTLATEYPYNNLTDEQVIENIQAMFFRPDSTNITFLGQPDICPKDLYDKMMSCWQKEPTARPDFDDLYGFLKSRVRLSEMAI